MKICFYNHTGHVSGAERMLFTVLRSLDQSVFKAVVFAPDSCQFKQVCSDLGLPFRTTSNLMARYTWRPDKLTSYLLSTLRSIIDLRGGLKAENPDLIHANTTRAAIVATLATIGFRTKILWQTHDILPVHPISTLIRTLGLVSRRSTIVAVSRATARAFAGRLGWAFRRFKPIVVLHNGIDTSTFVPADQASKVNFRKQLGLPNDAFLIGTVGQITPRKGHLELIQAIAGSLRTNLGHAALVVIGEPIFNNDRQYLDKLKNEVQKLGLTDKILFVGKQHIPSVMPALDVLVLNSRREPFGLVIVEAMACGTPVVATAIDGVLEIVENRESGLLFAPNDSKTLIRHLEMLASNPSLAEHLTSRGLKRARQFFSEEAYQRKINSLYRKLLRIDASLGDDGILSPAVHSSGK